MKNLKEYLNEGLISRKVSTKAPIRYTPNSREELRDIIVDLLNKGITDLNCIDITGCPKDALEFLFFNVQGRCNKPIGYIDISEWDIIGFDSLSGMFTNCKNFNADLSNWNVSNVEDMAYMFDGCKKFNSDLSNWNVKKCLTMEHMFDGCKIFDCDLSKWKLNKDTKTFGIFLDCDKLYKNNKIPDWFIPGK